MEQPRTYDELISSLYKILGKQGVTIIDHMVGDEITIRIAYPKQFGKCMDTGLNLKYIEYVLFAFGKFISGSRIDFERKYHKSMKTFLRKSYNNMPLLFGYALRAPMDMHDEEFSTRVALERLLYKIEYTEEFTKKCIHNQLKRLR